MGPRLTLYLPREAPEIAARIQRHRGDELGFEPTLSDIYREALTRGLRDMLPSGDSAIVDGRQLDIEDVTGAAPSSGPRV